MPKNKMRTDPPTAPSTDSTLRQSSVQASSPQAGSRLRQGFGGQAGQDLRRQAEEIAQGDAAQAPENLEALSPEATRRTLHELRVHQIELEMQNEELRRSQEELEASRARYFDLYNLTPVGYVTLSEEGLILEANLTAATLFGVARSALVKRPLTRFVSLEDQDIYYAHSRRLFETPSTDSTLRQSSLRLRSGQAVQASSPQAGSRLRQGFGGQAGQAPSTSSGQAGAPQVYELRMTRKDADPFWAHVEMTGAQDSGGAPVCRVVVTDITKRKIAELAGKRAEAALRQAHDDLEQRVAVRTEELRQANDELRTKITERKKAEEALRRNDRMLKDATKAAHLGCYEIDARTGKDIWSEETFRLFGLDPTTDPPSGETYSRLIHQDDVARLSQYFDECIRDLKPFDMVYRIIHSSGEIRYVHSTGYVETRPDSSVVKMSGTVQDITERKLAEEKLVASLEEKEILLREVHHRVKNNLAAIIALLDMQRKALGNPAASTALANIANRIASMALVHERLYQSENLSQIDFQEYLSALVSHLRTSLNAPRDLRCAVNAKGIGMGLDGAVPVGMIVNELVVNAMKYAFPDNKPRPGARQCELTIALERKASTITLIVADNGVGLPESIDWDTTSTLGLRLVKMLGEHQLGGTVDLDRSDGTRFTLQFKATYAG